ncbi:unnamed protein product, partial [Adineta steineri]
TVTSTVSLPLSSNINENNLNGNGQQLNNSTNGNNNNGMNMTIAGGTNTVSMINTLLSTNDDVFSYLTY